MSRAAGGAEGTGVQEIEVIEARLRTPCPLPELLAASFEAFELIRILARAGEDMVPALFAALMTTADAAVDGREAITAAPSLPPPTGPPPSASIPAGTSTGQIISALASLSALLHTRLAETASSAPTPADQASCGEAAGAARRIYRLMGRNT